VVGHPNCSGAQGAAKRCIGVSAWDAAIGQEVTIINDGILPITCSTAIVAGNEVQAAADGRIEPVGTGAVNGVPIGMAMDSQATVGGDCEILWYK
jgi:hypothetical protein